MKRIRRRCFSRQSLRSTPLFLSLSAFSAILLMTLLMGQFWIQKAHAQDAPLDAPSDGCIGTTGKIATNRCKYPESALPSPLPPLNTKFTDPSFGTQILRATDETDGSQLGTYYPFWPTFNSNYTYILIKGDAGNAIIKRFYESTFTVGPKEALPNRITYGGVNYGVVTYEGAVWHPTNPDLLYCSPASHNNGSGNTMTLFTYSISGHSFNRIRDFNSYKEGNYDFLWQMSMSTDGNVFAWSHVRGSYDKVYYYLVWRKSDDVILHGRNPDPANLNGPANINEVRLDKTGKWLSIPFNKAQDDGTNTGHSIGAQVLNITASTPDNLQVTNIDSDKSPGHGDLGKQTIVAIDNNNMVIDWRSLSTPNTTVHKFHYEKEDPGAQLDWTESNHISMLADNENWALVGTYSDPESPDIPNAGSDTHVFENEIFQIALDGSHRVRRICHTRSAFEDKDPMLLTAAQKDSNYGGIPKPTISRNGKYIAFTTNWETKFGRTDLLIAKIGAAPQLPTYRNVKLNAGGNRYYPPNSDYWQWDAYASGGIIAPPVASSQPIGNTTIPAIYRTERYGKHFSYSIPVPRGDYTVKLHFSENYWTPEKGTCTGGTGTSNPCVGKRVFDVKVEGQTVLDDYDIYKKMNKGYWAQVEPVQTTVTGTTLDINFDVSTVGGVEKDNAKISAIEVVPNTATNGFWQVPLTNATVSGATGATLTKTGSTNAWDAGAYSVNSIPYGKQGYVEFTAAELNTGKMCGLSKDYLGVDWTTIDYAISLGASNYVRIYENGQPIGVYGTYKVGDKYRVAVENGKVNYYQIRAGVTKLLYRNETALTATNYPLVVDASLYTGTPPTGSTAKSSITNTILFINTPSSSSAELPAEPLEVVWTNDVGVFISDSTLTKVQGSPDTWDAGASSVQTLYGDGYVEFGAADTDSTVICGLNVVDASQTYQDIDYGIFLNANATSSLRVYEKGLLKLNAGTYVVGDRFRVAIEGTEVNYYLIRDGQTSLLYSSPAPTLPVVVDTSLYSLDSNITDVTISGGWSD